MGGMELGYRGLGMGTKIRVFEWTYLDGHTYFVVFIGMSGMSAWRNKGFSDHHLCHYRHVMSRF